MDQIRSGVAFGLSLVGGLLQTVSNLVRSDAGKRPRSAEEAQGSDEEGGEPARPKRSRGAASDPDAAVFHSAWQHQSHSAEDGQAQEEYEGEEFEGEGEEFEGEGEDLEGEGEEDGGSALLAAVRPGFASAAEVAAAQPSLEGVARLRSHVPLRGPVRLMSERRPWRSSQQQQQQLQQQLQQQQHQQQQQYQHQHQPPSFAAASSALHLAPQHEPGHYSSLSHVFASAAPAQAAAATAAPTHVTSFAVASAPPRIAPTAAPFEQRTQQGLQALGAALAPGIAEAEERKSYYGSVILGEMPVRGSGGGGSSSSSSSSFSFAVAGASSSGGGSGSGSSSSSSSSSRQHISWEKVFAPFGAAPAAAAAAAAAAAGAGQGALEEEEAALEVSDEEEEGEEEEGGGIGAAAAAATGAARAWNALPIPASVDHVRIPATPSGQQLTEAEVAAAAALLLPRAPNGKLMEPRGWDRSAVVAVGGAGSKFRVTHGVMQQVSDGGWLSDDIVNCELARLQRGLLVGAAPEGSSSASSSSSSSSSSGRGGARGAGAGAAAQRFGPLGGMRGSAQPPLQRVWLTSSFFLKRLMQGREKYDFAGVARWPARAGVHLPSLEAVIVPVNMLLPDHWGLIALDLRRREAHYWDSWFRPSRKRDYRARMEALVRWVGDEMAAAAAAGGGGGAGGAPAAQQGWTFHVHSAEDGVPQQHNDYDCGVFMLFFIRALLAGEPFPRQSELRYCRLRLALDLASTVPHQ